ncbi:MAG: hemerythrin domain-containing protein [Ignavibacteria bacterium]|nr:hemerythrin domain-containing protein [Ignavibacteria bacterium]
MNKTLAVLYSEHEIIKSVIEFRERISSLSKSDPQKYKNIINELVNFFRNYADKFHHHKEEKLLFPLMCEKNEMLQESIVSEMLENHQDFRKLVNSIETEVNSDNFGEGASLLSKYTDLLLDHIAVEDDELFQIAETLFDDNELEKLYFDFQDIDRELGFDNKIELEKMKENLESILDSN